MVTKPKLGSSERSTICEDSLPLESTQPRSVVQLEMAVARSEPGALSVVLFPDGLFGRAAGSTPAHTVKPPALHAPSSSRLQVRRAPPCSTQVATSSTHASRHQRPSNP